MFDSLFSPGKKDKGTQRSGLASIIDTRSDSAIGAQAVLKGSLITRGELRLFGEIEGDVTTSDDVVIGEDALLKGNLLCEKVAVNGTLEGDILAHTVTVGGSGIITGQVRAVSFTSAEGGIIKGTVTMVDTMDIETLFREKAGLPPEEEDEQKPKKRGRNKKAEAETPATDEMNNEADEDSSDSGDQAEAETV